MKSSTLFLSAGLILSGCVVARAQWTPPEQIIPIVDGDFESQPITGYVGTITDPPGCGTYELGQVAGWTVMQNGGGGVGVVHWTCNGVNSNVLVLQNGYVEQDTGFQTKPGTYRLTFQVANRFYAYPGLFAAKIIIGNSVEELCETYGWAQGPFTTVTLTCIESTYFTNFPGSPDPMTVAGQTSEAGNQSVRIHFENLPHDGYSGWPVFIDNVSPLTFTPVF